ncbi:MAG: ATP-binding protein [Pleurocapsa sp.]
MISIPIPWNRSKWSTISFASTLYLCPILDLLLASIPPEWRAEIRLGLQEALVNAAKHGNKLDPSKTIVVRYAINTHEYSWVIVDQGAGFNPQCSCSNQELNQIHHLPLDEDENGRGLCILHEVFDRVHWNREGTQLTLCKIVTTNRHNQPLID